MKLKKKIEMEFDLTPVTPKQLAAMNEHVHSFGCSHCREAAYDPDENVLALKRHNYDHYAGLEYIGEGYRSKIDGWDIYHPEREDEEGYADDWERIEELVEVLEANK